MTAPTPTTGLTPTVTPGSPLGPTLPKPPAPSKARTGRAAQRLGDRVFSGLSTSAGVLILITLAGVALFCLVAGSIVSYAKARAEGLGLTCNVGLAERAERLILVLLGTLLAGLGLEDALPVLLWLLAAATAVTVVQRLVEVCRQAALAD